MRIIKDSGIPRLASVVRNVVRKRLATKPAKISNPRKIKPSTERNIVHFLMELRLFRISEPISIFLSSGTFSIEFAFKNYFKNILI
jgi:hypothetical protein